MNNCERHGTHNNVTTPCCYCKAEEKFGTSIKVLDGLCATPIDSDKQFWDIIGLTSCEDTQLVVGDHSGEIYLLPKGQYEFYDPDIDYETAQLYRRMHLIN